MSSNSSLAPQQLESELYGCTCNNCQTLESQERRGWWNREIIIRDPANIRGPSIRNLPNRREEQIGELGCVKDAVLSGVIIQEIPEVAPVSSFQEGSNGIIQSPKGTVKVTDISGNASENELPPGTIDDEGLELIYLVGIPKSDAIEVQLSSQSSMSGSSITEVPGRRNISNTECLNGESTKDGEFESSEFIVRVASRPIPDEESNENRNMEIFKLASGKEGRKSEEKVGKVKQMTKKEMDALRKRVKRASMTPHEKEKLREKWKLEKRASRKAERQHHVEKSQLKLVECAGCAGAVGRNKELPGISPASCPQPT